MGDRSDWRDARMLVSRSGIPQHNSPFHHGGGGYEATGSQKRSTEVNEANEEE
jgi:hypothetical protein